MSNVEIRTMDELLLFYFHLQPSAKGQKAISPIKKKNRAVVDPVSREDLVKIREKANKENHPAPAASRAEANVPAPPPPPPEVYCHSWYTDTRSLLPTQSMPACLYPVHGIVLNEFGYAAWEQLGRMARFHLLVPELNRTQTRLDWASRESHKLYLIAVFTAQYPWHV